MLNTIDYERDELNEMLIEHIGMWFNIEPDENGDYDLDDYDWTAGCYNNHTWMSLKEFLDCIQNFLEI